MIGIHQEVSRFSLSGRDEIAALPPARVFGRLLKRGIGGRYVSVEPFHLFRYVDEQAFRFNNRKPMDDGDRFRYLMRKIVGKRLTYAQLTGKEAGYQRARDTEVENRRVSFYGPCY